VQVWLGHHSPAFTLATYVHLLADDLPDADLFADAAGSDGLRDEPGAKGIESPVISDSGEVAVAERTAKPMQAVIGLPR